MRALTAVLGALIVFSAVAYAAPKNEKKTMYITIHGKNYAVWLEANETAQAIAAALPLDLKMERFGGHEFWATLPFVPPFAQPRTSQIKAGHVYYWDGWNAFVINYIDWDISPYKVVHIGEIADRTICAVLDKAPEHITAKAE